MISEHIYTAEIIGTPDVVLSPRGGRITLDAGSAPHVQAEIEIPIPAPDVLEMLDPRDSVRVRVTVVSDVAGGQLREFNLGLRDRPLALEPGTVSLTLASDEELLSDYAPLADDLTPLDYQASLRSIVNYVLDQAIPGASLEPGSIDPPFRVLTDARQLYENASIEGTGAGTQSWLGQNCSAARSTAWASDGAASLRMYSPTSSDSYATLGGDLDTGEMRVGMQAGQTYTVSRDFRLAAALGGSAHSRARRIVAFWVDGSGIHEVASTAAPNAAGVVRQTLTFTLPEDATAAAVRFYHGHSAGESWTDAVRLSANFGKPGEDLDVFFDGNTADTSEYGYVWDGTPIYSQSRRIALIDRAPELLVWKAGNDALSFVMPIVQSAGLRLVCDEQRRWTLRDETYLADGTMSIRHGVNLIGGTERISRDSGLWFDARVTRYRWTDMDGNAQEKVDAYAQSTPYTKLTELVIEAPYPGPGRSEYAVRRAQGRGREVTATRVADWTANAEQTVSIFLAETAPQTGISQSVEFDLNTDRMTVETRTIELPFGVIDLLTGTIDSLVGTIDDL